MRIIAAAGGEAVSPARSAAASCALPLGDPHHPSRWPPRGAKPPTGTGLPYSQRAHLLPQPPAAGGGHGPRGSRGAYGAAPRAGSVGTHAASSSSPPSSSPSPALSDLRICKLVGSMAVQTSQRPSALSLERPQVQTVSGAVNFYSAVLNLGSLTCQLLLKEYPPSTKSLGINELRIYEELIGPQVGFFSELVEEARAVELEASGSSPRRDADVREAVPPLYAAFEAFLVPTDMGGAAGGSAPWLQTTAGDVPSAGEGPSVWLAFRYGEHGTATLLDYREEHLRRLREGAEEENRRRRGETTEDYGRNLRSILSILVPFERVPVDPSGPWGSYVRAAMAGSLRSLAALHSRGVAHGSLSPACLLVNTSLHEEAERLRVRIFNMGYAATVPPFLGEGEQDGVGEAFREDIQSLGLAFTEILFPRMAQAGTDFRRVIVDIYGCDMRAVSEFVCEEEPWAASLLGAGEGAGWELLRLMLSPGTTATPRQLLSSVFFAPPR